MNLFKKLPYLPQKVWLYIHFPSIKWIRVSSHQKELLADYISWSTNTINFHVECVKIVAKLCGHNRKREHVGPTEHEGNCHKVKPSPHPVTAAASPKQSTWKLNDSDFKNLWEKYLWLNSALSRKLETTVARGAHGVPLCFCY